MTTLIEMLKKGVITKPLKDEITPFSLEAHESHVNLLSSQNTYDVFGCKFSASDGLYHPHPTSSSVFLIRTLLRESFCSGKLLELGCGVGAVGLSLLAHGKVASAVMTDINECALEQTAINAKRLMLDSKIKIQQSDVFASIGEEKFDLIVFNLPLMHEKHSGKKHQALDDVSGKIARSFFDEAINYLTPNGRCFFTYSNISDAALLESFSRTVDLKLLAAEWVVNHGFWLMVYSFKNEKNICV